MAQVTKQNGDTFETSLDGRTDVDTFTLTTATELRWTTTDGGYVYVKGNFAYDGSDVSGEVDSIALDTTDNGSVDLHIEFDSPRDIADQLVQDADTFWNAVFSEADAFEISAVSSTTLAGDGRDMRDPTVAADDRVKLSGAFITFHGDFASARSNNIFGGNDNIEIIAHSSLSGGNMFVTGDMYFLDNSVEVYGGDDTIADNSGQSGNRYFYGDFFSVQTTSTAHGGDDNLTGGTGVAATLVGDIGQARGTIYAGDDHITGGSFSDTLIGDVENLSAGVTIEFGNDTIKGGDGSDYIYGDYDNLIASFNNLGGGNDILNGGAGADLIVGQTGNDILRGGIGTDLLYGGEGDDELHSEAGEDAAGPETYSGGADTDTLVLSGGDGYVIHDLTEDDLSALEVIRFDPLNDNGDGPRTLHLTTDQILNAFAGAPHVIGDALSNNFIIIAVDEGADAFSLMDMTFANWSGTEDRVQINITDTSGKLIQGSSGQDHIYGNQGDDELVGGTGRDYLSGADGADTLRGGIGADTLEGGNGGDVLEGNDGQDLIKGQSGADTLIGGAGDDEILGGNGADTLKGFADNDDLSGGKGTDKLLGGSGGDSLFGGKHADKLFGGGGSDALNGGEGDDRLQGDAGADDLDGGVGSDKLFGKDGKDMLFGKNGQDILKGGQGNDMLNGGGGNDQLTGGAGNDKFVYKPGFGADTVHDFTDDQDTLIFDSALKAPGMNKQEFLDAFARDTGAHVKFDFGGGDTLKLKSFAEVGDLLNDIGFA